VVEGAAKNGLGTVVKQLEWRDMSIPLDKHHRGMGQGVWKLRRWSPGSGGVVSIGRVFDNTQCLRKLFKELF
jgi:hypothetical protein